MKKTGPCGLRILTAAVVVGLAGCAAQRLHSDGLGLLRQGNHDAALPMLQEAARLEPGNAEFRIDMLNEVSAYAADLVRRGDEARAAGRLEEAAGFYRKAQKVNPANDRAQRGLEGLESDVRMARLLGESEKLLRDGQLEAARDKAKAAVLEVPRNPAALHQLDLVQEQLDKAKAAKAAQAAAQSVMNRPVTLQFRDANLRMVFEALSRTTGLNVILDRDVRADLKTTIFVKDASVEDTVDLILLQNQLEKRTLNANTMFVYPATAAKQKEYQDLQVRTFQIGNADVKYLQTVLKTVLKIKEISVDDRSSTLVIRDTPEAIAVAAKIIAAHDVPEPEVMLEVAVLEVSHDRLENLGIEFPTAISLSTPTTDPGGGSLTLNGLRALRPGQLLVSPLSANINFKLQDTDANLLASPRIRARNKEKARILIGDRVPIITNTVTPVASGSGVVTGSVQYQDVGLKLEFEPQVYSDEEVGIKISLEVSTIAKEISGPNGSLAYQIGTRNAQTVVRLRDGETQVLGGLISSEDRNSASKIPGLGHLPVVGRLFGNNSGEGKKTEIILSITPRIIRPPAFIDASLREVFSGTESSIRQRALQLDPVGSVRAQSSGGPAPAAAPGPARPAPATPPATPPATAPVRPTATPPAATTSAAGAGGPTPPAGAAEYLRNLQNRFAKPSAAGAPAPAVSQPVPATADPPPAPEAPASDAKGSP
ncbi:MAG: secretin N-terminal domain-containing protein [Caldimonas sp.]